MDKEKRDQKKEKDKKLKEKRKEKIKIRTLSDQKVFLKHLKSCSKCELAYDKNNNENKNLFDYS